MSAESSARLREPPEQRFAGPVHLIDLRKAGKRLLAEPPHPTQGHRQITLYRHGAATLALFHFGPGGSLVNHRANAVVNVHVMTGQVNVQTPQGTHRVEAGQMLVLAPNVPHDVQAVKTSRLLLTVCLKP
ncbi:MAG: AraC family ligand binding domain-containing protein [Planctomycetes bacterium]|nr:AraC family ligand binding domain-containing protein [Planctomycetota bacterium]